MNDTYFHRCESPIGELLLTSDGQSLTGLYMEQRRYGPEIEREWCEESGPFREALRQLRAYFDGALETFDLPLAPSGTDFQLRVWKALREIPFGETWSYGALAKRVGVPGGARAVGGANGHNPISIVVPCHRVIGGSGALTGYGGGIERKRWLLEHEARVLSAGASSAR